MIIQSKYSKNTKPLESFEIEGLDLLDWNEIHNTVQLVLKKVDETVLDHCPADIEIGSGRTDFNNKLNRSYRLYCHSESVPRSPDDHRFDIDSVVVSVDFDYFYDPSFSPDERAMTVYGHIDGATLGDIQFVIYKRCLDKAVILE